MQILLLEIESVLGRLNVCLTHSLSLQRTEEKAIYLFLFFCMFFV